MLEIHLVLKVGFIAQVEVDQLASKLVIAPKKTKLQEHVLENVFPTPICDVWIDRT